MNSKYVPIFWCTVDSGYFLVVVRYPPGLVISVVSLVEGSSILLIMEGYSGMYGCFYFFPFSLSMAVITF